MSEPLYVPSRPIRVVTAAALFDGLAGGTEAEKQSQLDRLRDFHERNADAAHDALAALRHFAHSGGNVFSEPMNAARVCSLGQITDTFFDVGGQYRRNV